jgi:hypothetical protein
VKTPKSAKVADFAAQACLVLEDIEAVEVHAVAVRVLQSSDGLVIKGERDCYNVRPILLINPVSHLVFETALPVEIFQGFLSVLRIVSSLEFWSGFVPQFGEFLSPYPSKCSGFALLS